ncbi:hypothetical protein QOM21_00305 [Streptomyces sp. Pv4-95]|uniref:hypothetical protein n=1 Tax=Streptomyces sp. Pv4-95 TaxID=3049543 RepID=UPI003891E1FF
MGELPRDNVSHREVSLDFLCQRRGEAMGRVLRMPGEDQLPPGPRRVFVEALFTYYRSASRPTLRKIAELIPQKYPDATGSPETVRRTLLGLSTPANWDTVDAIVTVLCDIAQIDPDAPTTSPDDPWATIVTPATPRTEIKKLWHAVFDADPRNPEQRGRPQSGSDPWRVAPADGPEAPLYSDEPPF